MPPPEFQQLLVNRHQYAQLRCESMGEFPVNTGHLVLHFVLDRLCNGRLARIHVTKRLGFRC